MRADRQTPSIVEAKLPIPQGTARIVRLANDRPNDRVFRREDRYWLDLCLTPRPENARGGYTDRWGPHRFEKLGEIFLVPPGEALHVRSEQATTHRGEVSAFGSALVEMPARAAG